MAKSGFKVLLPVFPGFNTLDLNGPLEVLKNSALPDDTFTVYVVSATELTKACEGVQVKRDITITSLLDPERYEYVQVELSEIDAMIVPGARRAGIDAVLNARDGADGLLNLIANFGKLETKTKPRWLISICTGSELLGSLALLSGKPATTHWAAIPNLEALGEEVCSGNDLSKIEVLRKRFVDGGLSDSGVRIVTSGGISCGIDCVLWYVSQVVDLDTAKKVAHFMDYPWGFAPVDYTQGYQV